MTKLNAVILFLTLASLCGCNRQTSGTILLPDITPPDKTEVSVHDDKTDKSALQLRFGQDALKAIIVINGENSAQMLAPLSRGRKGAQWNGYCWMDQSEVPVQGIFPKLGQAFLNLKDFYDKNGTAYNPETEIPKSVEVYYRDHENKPKYWKVNVFNIKRG